MRSAVRRVPVRLVLLCVGAVVAAVGPVPAATLYKWVDAQGVVHYSDTPQPGAEKLQVSGAQTFHTTPVPVAPPPSAASAAPSGGYVSCSITQPADGTELYAPEAVDVSVQTAPELQPGDYVSVSVDGQSLGTADGSHVRMSDPPRGQHSVSAQVRSSDGTVLCTAPSISFSVQRPSVDSPKSPVKRH